MVHRVFTTFLITIPLRALATCNTDQDAMLFILEKLCSLELLRVFMKNTKLLFWVHNDLKMVLGMALIHCGISSRIQRSILFFNIYQITEKNEVFNRLCLLGPSSKFGDPKTLKALKIMLESHLFTVLKVLEGICKKGQNHKSSFQTRHKTTDNLIFEVSKACGKG